MKYQSNQNFLFNLIADMATAAIIKMKGIKGPGSLTIGAIFIFLSYCKR